MRQPGWQSGEARLVGVDDALAADNVCPFVLHVRPQPTYVLDDPASERAERPTSSLFLECALAPAARNVAANRRAADATVARRRSHRSGRVRSRGRWPPAT